MTASKKLEAFLVGLANLQQEGDKRDYEQWLERYRTFFPPSFPEISALKNMMKTATGLRKYAVEAAPICELFEFCWKVRKVWKETDLRLKFWYSMELRRHFHLAMNPKSSFPPDDTPFEQAMVYLERNWDRARFCANPECPAPYYFSSHRKPTRYCDPKCAGPAKKEAKRRWWADNRGKTSGGKRGSAKTR